MIRYKAFFTTSAAFFALATICQQVQASPLQFVVDSYTADSVTFTLTGSMPATDPGTLADGPNEIDISYSGNLWTGPQTPFLNSLTADPFVGSGGLEFGYTGGFSITPTNYSWMYFFNPLDGLDGTGTPVTLSWGPASDLNLAGTGSFDLYWGNLTNGPDSADVANILLGSAAVVDGVIVPEPGTLALLALGLPGLALWRRRRISLPLTLG